MAEHPQAAVGPAHGAQPQNTGAVTYEQVGVSGAAPAPKKCEEEAALLQAAQVELSH